MFSPCLEVFVYGGSYPVLIFCHCHLAVVRSNGLGDSAEVSQRVIVDSQPVCDVAAGHAFDVEVITV